MSEFKIFNILVHNALINGYYPQFRRIVEETKNTPDFEELIDGMVEAILEIDSEYKYRLLFDPKFAESNHYSLSDLGSWLDQKKDILEYFENHLKNNRDENVVWIENL